MYWHIYLEEDPAPETYTTIRYHCPHSCYSLPCLIHQQGNVNCPMQANAYTLEHPFPVNAYFNHYEVNHPHMDAARRNWDCPSTLENEEPATLDMPVRENRDTTPPLHVTPHERNPVRDNSQVFRQDNIDPDSMTYEELIELGEEVGAESRGLSQNIIDALPTSRYKPGGMLSRKKSKERCVICQMSFKMGETVSKLPCKHAYHWECISKWLTIRKVCPTCNVEVVGDISNQ